MQLCSPGRACAVDYVDCRKDDGCTAKLHGSGESSQFVLVSLCWYLFSAAGSPLRVSSGGFSLLF